MPANASRGLHGDNPGRPGRLVSVLLPVHNAAPYLAETLASVRAQTWVPLELVAIDDGSTDGSDRILKEAAQEWTASGRSMRVVHQPNSGAAAARNAALELAQGEFVAFLDADDRWPCDLLARLVATLDARPDLDMTFPRYRHIDAAGRPTGVMSAQSREALSIPGVMIDTPIHSATGVVLRRGAAMRAGWFDTAMRGCIDLDYWVRIAALRDANIAGTPEVLADYRKRTGQITGDWRVMERHWLAVCDKLAAAGHGLSRAELSRGRSLHRLYCAAIAYDAGQHADSRRLVREAWRDDPAAVIFSGAGRIRTLAALASLLPPRLHDGLRTWVNARQKIRPGTGP